MDLFTVKETARLLRVSPITIRRYIAAGRLPAERVGRGVRIRREAIEEFVTPVVPRAGSQNVDGEDALEDGNLVEIYSPSSPDGVEFVPEHLLGKPFTMDDPLWEIVGIGRSDGPNDVASNKHKYLAEAILSEME